MPRNSRGLSKKAGSKSYRAGDRDNDEIHSNKDNDDLADTPLANSRDLAANQTSMSNNMICTSNAGEIASNNGDVMLQSSVPAYYDNSYETYLSKTDDAKISRQKQLKQIETIQSEEQKQNLNTLHDFQELMNSKTNKDFLAHRKPRRRKHSRCKDRITNITALSKNESSESNDMICSSNDCGKASINGDTINGAPANSGYLSDNENSVIYVNSCLRSEGGVASNNEDTINCTLANSRIFSENESSVSNSVIFVNSCLSNECGAASNNEDNNEDDTITGTLDNCADVACGSNSPIDIDESDECESPSEGCVSDVGDRLSSVRETYVGAVRNSDDMTWKVITKMDDVTYIADVVSNDNNVSVDDVPGCYDAEASHDIPETSPDLPQNILTSIQHANTDSETDTCDEAIACRGSEVESIIEDSDEVPKPMLLVRNIFCENDIIPEDDSPEALTPLQDVSVLEPCESESVRCGEDSASIDAAVRGYLSQQVSESEKSELKGMVVAGMDYVNMLLHCSAPENYDNYDNTQEAYLSKTEEIKSERQKQLKEIETIQLEEQKQNLNTFKDFQEFMTSKGKGDSLPDRKRRKRKQSRTKNKMKMRKKYNNACEINIAKIPGKSLMSSDSLVCRKRFTSESTDVVEMLMNDGGQANTRLQSCHSTQILVDLSLEVSDLNVRILKDFQACVKSGKARTKLSVIVKGKKHIELLNPKLCEIKMHELAAQSVSDVKIKTTKKTSNRFNKKFDRTIPDSQEISEKLSDPERRETRSQFRASKKDKISTGKSRLGLRDNHDSSYSKNSKTKDKKIVEMVNSGIDYVSSLLQKYNKKKYSRKCRVSDSSGSQISSKTIFTTNDRVCKRKTSFPPLVSRCVRDNNLLMRLSDGADKHKYTDLSEIPIVIE